MKKCVILVCVFVRLMFAQTLTIHFMNEHMESLNFTSESSFYFSDSTTVITKLLSPTQGASNIDIKPLFVWRAVEGSQYELLLSDSPEFSDSVLYLEELDTNRYQSTVSLNINTNYYWKIRLKGQEHWTLAWHFTTWAPSLPTKINSWALEGNANSLFIYCDDVYELDSLMVLWSEDGKNFYDTLYCDSSDMEAHEIMSSEAYVKIAGINAKGLGEFSELLYVNKNVSSDRILIVQAFDRQTSGNTGNLILRHAHALSHLGCSIASTSNEALTQGLVDLNQYFCVDYILGEESTSDETFSFQEQLLIQDYLQQGGNLFVSGSEIAWDLDYKGSLSDKLFCHEFLHLSYFQDSPGNKVGEVYTLKAIGDTIFSSLNEFNFDDGNYGSYNVRYPDVYTPLNDAQKFLIYPSYSGAAGIVYEGQFPGGLSLAKIMVLGVPFETIYPEQKRFELMSAFMDFAHHGLAVNNVGIPGEHSLLPNYPNPFNPKTIVAYQLQEHCAVELAIFDIKGRKVETLVHEIQPSGIYKIVWDASQLSSGIYFTVLSVDNAKIATRKMTLLK